MLAGRQESFSPSDAFGIGRAPPEPNDRLPPPNPVKTGFAPSVFCAPPNKLADPGVYESVFFAPKPMPEDAGAAPVESALLAPKVNSDDPDVPAGSFFTASPDEVAPNMKLGAAFLSVSEPPTYSYRLFERHTASVYTPA